MRNSPSCWLIAILICVIAVADSNPVEVHVLGFIVPCSNPELDLETMSVTDVFDHLDTKIGYDLNQVDLVNSHDFFKAVELSGGSIIGYPVGSIVSGEEVETSFVYPVTCRRIDPSGMQQEWESSFEESPGIRLVLTPWRQEGEVSVYRVDYSLDLALNAGGSGGSTGNLTGGCPELSRFKYQDSITVNPEQWYIIGMSIIEDTGTGGMYEVWLLTKIDRQ